MTAYYNEKVERMSAEEKKALQSERLVKVVKRVYDNVPTYRAKMDAIGLKPEDIKSIDDITKLPFTTKSDLRNNYPFGMFASPLKDIVRLHASSGTTGKLTVAGCTQHDLDDWSEAVARGFVSCGVSRESVIHVAYGYGLFTGGLGAHDGGTLLGATVVPASAGNTNRQLTLIKDFGADTICCTPSYAVYLADEFKKAGIPTSGVACECEYQAGPHVQDDFFYPEIIDPETLEPVEKGARGELVFTTLDKEGMPLIRYRTRDLCAIIYEPCKCGRTSVRLAKITGRSDDMLIIRGVNVFPSQIESVLIKDKRVSPHYHITIDRINNLDTMEIEVELDRSIAFDEVQEIETLQKKLSAEIASAIGVSAKIKLVSCGTVPRSEGKAVFVTDKRKI